MDNYTDKIKQFKENKGLTSKMMAMLLFLSINSYRNYISKGLFKEKHYDRLLNNYNKVK